MDQLWHRGCQSEHSTEGGHRGNTLSGQSYVYLRGEKGLGGLPTGKLKVLMRYCPIRRKPKKLFRIDWAVNLPIML